MILSISASSEVPQRLAQGSLLPQEAAAVSGELQQTPAPLQIEPAESMQNQQCPFKPFPLPTS